MNWLNKFMNAIVADKLLSARDHVLVGLSGGPDSVALLHLLTRLRKKMKLSLTAVYVNHQIRKKAALQEEKFCQNLCDRLGLELDIVIEDIPAIARERKKGLEETAREFRYEVYELLAKENDCNKIALGHHADDRVETILFRILRGTGATGLAGIPIKRDKYIRPLYYFTKEEILAYLKRCKLSYCIDKSNLGSDFSRNLIRNKLLPLIRLKINPRVDQALLNLSETLTAEEQYLEKIVKRNIKKAVNITPGGKLEVDLQHFKSYDLWLKRRILRFCLKFLSGLNQAPDKEIIDRLIGWEKKALSLPNGLQVLFFDNRMVIYRKKKTTAYISELKIDKELKLDCLKLNFMTHLDSMAAIDLKCRKRSKKVTLDWQKIVPPLSVRNIKPGDRFQPLGLEGRKKAGDYLTDKKVPVVYRDEIPVVCDKEGIIWLVGYEIADRVKVDHQTKKVVTIEVSSRT